MSDIKANAVEAVSERIGGYPGEYVLPLDIVDAVAKDAVDYALPVVLAPIEELTHGRFDHSWDCSSPAGSEYGCDCWLSALRAVLDSIKTGDKS